MKNPFTAITQLLRGRSSSATQPPVGSYAAGSPEARAFYQTLQAGSFPRDSAGLVKAIMARTRTTAVSVGVPDLGFKGARQQLFQRFNLIDLYGMAHNNSTVKTATVGLKQEVFRRGMEWEAAFSYRCRACALDFSAEEHHRQDGKCSSCGGTLSEPNLRQRARFEAFMPKVNIYDQSFTHLCLALEDDLNIVDDAFLFLSSEYTLLRTTDNRPMIVRNIKQLFRLDPIFVEFDTDSQNRPGFAHHICLAHRHNLLDGPTAAGWEQGWRGECPIDGLPTFPVIYRYTPTRGVYGAQKGGVDLQKDALYLVPGEVLHASKFSPSELYGYSPLLAVYEKVLSLIGMDRYLYDYFFERQMPQGVVTTTTDNPDDLEIRKEQVLQEVLANPHYIPWLAVSSRTGAGQTEVGPFSSPPA